MDKLKTTVIFLKYFTIYAIGYKIAFSVFGFALPFINQIFQSEGAILFSIGILSILHTFRALPDDLDVEENRK